MAQRMSRTCLHKGCRAIHRNANAYCESHQEDALAKSRNRQGKYSSWYTTSAWRALRAQQLQAQPLCEYCMKHGQVTAATVCDHVTPHRGDAALFWSGPFQSLCQTCHSSTKQREEGRARVSRDRPA